VYLEGEKAVRYRSKRMNPGLGRNFEAMDPLEWLARMVGHIPDPGKHRTLRYGSTPTAREGRASRSSREPVLEPLGLWSDENQRPPPEPREVRVVPVADAGREIGEAW